MRIFLTSTEPDDETVRAISDGLGAHLDLAASFEEADLALFVESAPVKFRDYPKRLRAHELVQADPNRCFVFDFSDWPTPFLPGLYTSLPRARFDPHRTRAVSYWLGAPHARLDPSREPPRLLASFRGAASSDLRARLLGHDFGAAISITRTEWRWGEARDDRDDYARELRDSAFVLCPRGNATTTLRIYETMQAGRVPVILADDWVAPHAIAWEECAVHVPEAELERLPEILKLHDAAALGARAREEWEQWCRAGEPVARQFTQELGELRRLHDADERAIRDRWTSHRFLWRYGLHPLQR